MPNSHGSNELSQTLLVEHVPDHAVRLALEEPSLGTAGHDSTGVLSASVKRETISTLSCAQFLFTRLRKRRTLGAEGAEVPRPVLAQRGTSATPRG